MEKAIDLILEKVDIDDNLSGMMRDILITSPKKEIVKKLAKKIKKPPVADKPDIPITSAPKKRGPGRPPKNTTANDNADV